MKLVTSENLSYFWQKLQTLLSKFVKSPDTVEVTDVLSVSAVDENGFPTEYTATKVTDDMDALETLVELEIVVPAMTNDGAVYTSSDGAIYML